MNASRFATCACLRPRWTPSLSAHRPLALWQHLGHADIFACECVVTAVQPGKPATVTLAVARMGGIDLIRAPTIPFGVARALGVTLAGLLPAHALCLLVLVLGCLVLVGHQHHLLASLEPEALRGDLSLLRVGDQGDDLAVFAADADLGVRAVPLLVALGRCDDHLLDF